MLRKLPGRTEALIAEAGEMGDLILTNEAGMLLISSHFAFWNSGKAGMSMKTKVVKRGKPECR